LRQRPKSDQSDSPESVVTAFYQAVQQKDKVTARTFLSANANRENFQATFEDNDNTPSIYTENIVFQITDSTISSDNKTAKVIVKLTVNGNPVDIEMNLEKDVLGKWTMTDYLATANSPTIPGTQVTTDTMGSNARIVIRLEGPADLYLTSPDSKHAGVDPSTKKDVNEINEAFFGHTVPEFISLHGLVGTWNLQIVGNGIGKYTLTTELLDVENHETQAIDGDIKEGLIISYNMSYPTQKGKPVELIPLAK